jgi:transposase
VLEMASASASGSVTVEDQKSYIKIETLRGKRPTEIHSALREVCGEQTVGRSTVSHLAVRFHEGRVSINDDPRPGRPKTSTDERRVKLVADFLEADRRVTCEEIS